MVESQFKSYNNCEKRGFRKIESFFNEFRVIVVRILHRDNPVVPGI